jgi:hypothetical protein
LAGVWKRGPGPQVASFPECSARKLPWLVGWGVAQAGLLAVSAVCHYPHPLWPSTDRYLPAYHLLESEIETTDEASHRMAWHGICREP